MKKLLVLSMGLALGMSAMAQTTFDCIGDTWVRQSAPAAKYYDKATVELAAEDIKNEADEVIGYNARAALLSFRFNVPAGQKVQKATLHLVTERFKGSDVALYGYDEFDESRVTWNSEGERVYELINSSPVLTFTPAGHKGKAIFDAGISEAKQTLEAWTNDIDVTAYLKSLPTTSTSANFMLYATGGQTCFYSKENEGQDNAFKETPNATTFSASELMPELYVTFVEDSDNSTDVIAPTADTFVRSSAANQRYGHLDAMEIYSFTADDGTPVIFAGLIKFPLPADINMSGFELNGVQLRLVTTMLKGNRTVEVYPYDYDFADEVKYETAGVNVESVLTGEPILTFDANGQGNKAIGSDEISDDYRTAESWTNYIDLTDYVKANLPMNTLSLMLIKPETSNRAVKFATKETGDVTNAKDPSLVYAAEDLVPQLVVSYSKTGDNGVEKTLVIDLNAPVEYYNLNGVKVANPDKGIYIVRQGNTVKKVVL